MTELIGKDDPRYFSQTCNKKCTPYKAVEYMKEAFKATELISQEHERI